MFALLHHRKRLTMDARIVGGFKWCGGLRVAFGVPANHRLSILYCRLRRGSFPCARPLLSDAPFTRSGFGLPLSRFFAFLAPLLLIQIPSEPLISKTAAEAGSSNCKCSCDLNWPAARCHVPWTFVQRIFIRKRKLTTSCTTLMRHSLSYRDWLGSSNAEVAPRATSLSTVRARASRRRSLCLRRGYSPFFVDRATFLTTSQTSGPTKIVRH
jgi:hypothetical protein